MYLKRLKESDYKKFKELAEDYYLFGDDRYKKPALSKEAYYEFLTKLLKYERKETVPPNRVPSYSFWLVDESETLLGSIRLRKYLNEELKIEGGHIGYDIRPSARNKGFGTKMLALCLEKAKELNFKKVLITCYSDNLGSVKVIENNGGVLDSIEPSPKRNRKDTKRYWITLDAPKS